MNSIVGTDQEVGATAGKLCRRGQHQLAHARPVASIDALHVLGERARVHRDVGMIVRAEQRRPFDAHRPITKRRAFGGAGNDTDMLRHAVECTSQFWKRCPYWVIMAPPDLSG